MRKKTESTAIEVREAVAKPYQPLSISPADFKAAISNIEPALSAEEDAHWSAKATSGKNSGKLNAEQTAK